MDLLFDDDDAAPAQAAPVVAVEPPRAAVAIRLARAKLTVTRRRKPIWPLIAAAAFAAASAVTLAVAIILGPPQF